jgi:hypothetical protein
MNVPSFRRFLVAALSSVVLMASGSAHAAFRAYLSVSGVDNPACSLAAPCRLLPAALTAVDAGGEIWMLNSANYNTAPVVITKSVTILAVPGEAGSVVGLSGNAFAIIGTGIDVTLQNLNILSFSGTGDIGVNIGNAASVTIVNCSIFGFKGTNPQSPDGIAIFVNTGTNATKVNVVGSVVRNNVHGIVVSGNGRATISKTHVLANAGIGIWSNSLTGTSIVHVSDSVSSGNAYGYVATGQVQGVFSSYMYVTRSIATENAASGFVAEGGISASMVVGDSIATNNAIGFENTAAATSFQSRLTNTVTGNTANVSGTITTQAGV